MKDRVKKWLFVYKRNVAGTHFKKKRRKNRVFLKRDNKNYTNIDTSGKQLHITVNFVLQRTNKMSESNSKAVILSFFYKRGCSG